MIIRISRLCMLLNILFILFYSCSDNTIGESKEIRVTYFPGDTVINQILHFNEFAQLDGIYLSFHENGRTQRMEYYTEGKIDGEAFSFYDNGQLESKTIYKKGRKFGIAYGFYPLGNIRYEMKWWNDTPVDTAKEFDVNGFPQILIIYNDNGQIKHRLEYSRDGIEKF